MQEFAKQILSKNGPFFNLEGYSYSGKIVKDYLKIIELKPDEELRYLRKIANIYKESNQNVQRIEYLNQCLLKDPNDPWLFYELSWSYYYLKKYDDAISNIRNAIYKTTDKDDEQTFRNGLDAFLKEKNLEEKEKKRNGIFNWLKF